MGASAWPSYSLTRRGIAIWFQIGRSGRLRSLSERLQTRRDLTLMTCRRQKQKGSADALRKTFCMAEVQVTTHVIGVEGAEPTSHRFLETS